MGNFYTCTQILNDPPLSKDDFLKKFCEAMKREGYAVCETGEGEKEYSFSFSDEKGCRWVALYSESYEDGNQKAKADTSRIAGMLGTFCINTTVIDSDCAILELYDKSGSKVDNLIMGRAEDYFGENIPEPERNAWEPLLNNGVSWEQFIEIVHGDYVFVEDGLSKLSEIIGSNDLIFDEISSSEKILAFKKEVQKEKKLTVNAAFKKIFGEMLIPMGFVKAKTKIPYFMRVVSDEIIHIVGIRSHSTGVSIVSGVVTVYRKDINFNSNQPYDSSWLKPISEFYKYHHRYDSDRKQELSMMWFSYQKSDSGSLISALQQASEKMNEWVLPVLDKIQSTDDMIGYMFSMGGYVYPALSERSNPEDGYPCSDGALMLTLDDPYLFPEREKEFWLQCALYEWKHHVNDRTEEQYKAACERICNQYEKNKALLSHMLEKPDDFEKCLDEISRRRTRNTEILESYGLKI
ncbi:MAG: hypothetical protein IJL67_09895 [Oscillospiraceae bacterium]|nr:hypothetical protein [Oscillospiraceae bacterium]